MGREIPEKGLHRNRLHVTPCAGGINNCFSRTSHLTGKTPSAFGSGQSMGILNTGVRQDDPSTWPKNWHKKDRVLRVPKCVILSSFPFWTLFWPKAYFYFPRDVIGDSGYGFLNNYYYLEQWNGLDPEITENDPDYDWLSGYDVDNPQVAESLIGESGYQNNRAWNDMRYLTDEDKLTVNNARKNCEASSQDSEECASIPAYLLNKCPNPPKRERYFKCVAEVANPYYELHARLTAAFLEAKAILESDEKDPIYVMIPQWMPTKLYQVRNAFLKQKKEKLNRDHGGSVNGRPCQIRDTLPCYTHANICWAPPYPDRDDPRNSMAFDGPNVPWLSSLDPQFGTNSLHMYFGHPNHSFIGGGKFFDYQAWPLSPEMQYIAGPVGMGSYLGDARPYFAGRRVVWRAEGFNYGYAGHGPKGLYNNAYGTLVAAAAANYNNHYYKFRNMTTQIYGYNAEWSFPWNFQAIEDDRRQDCPGTQFWFGYENFADFQQVYQTNEELQVVDCSSIENLKVAETQNWFPDRPSIQEAVGVGIRLTQRVMDYYNNNDRLAGDYYRYALAQNPDLKGVTYEGQAGLEWANAERIVEHVREYFAENP
jgi:hypothetical protein